VATIYGDQANTLNSPRKVHADGNEVFVTDTGNHRVMVFDHNGNFVRKFGDVGEEGSDGRLASPFGIVVVGGDVYVSDAALSKVAVFSRDGTFKRYFGEEVIGKAVDIAHLSGKLYFADVLKHQIVVTDMDGSELLRFGKPGKGGEGYFWFPNGVKPLTDGRILVADMNNSRVQVFNSQGEFVEVWQGDIKKSAAWFASPSGIAVDKEGNIYVVDPLTRRVMIMDSDGQPIGPLSDVGLPEENDSLSIPFGVAVDSRQRLYVVDYGQSRLVIYDLL
jgi:DNA-binding beta-propeller fold protein YncE